MRRKDAPEPGFFRRVYLFATTAAMVLMVTALTLGLLLGSRWLEERARVISDAGPASTPAIVVEWPPVADPTATNAATWLHPSFQDEILQIAQHQLELSHSALSADPLRRVATALAESGWFERVPRVRREGGQIRVSGVWRVPAAVVRYDGRDYVVGWDAFLMPPVYEPGVTNLRVISGVALPPPTRADGSRHFNAPWPGEDVIASLELLSETLRQPWASQVAGVDASEFASAGRLTIVTANGTRVVWGGRPTRPAIGEVSTSQKLAHINDNLRDSGRIDGGFPVVFVNQERRLVSRTPAGATP